MLSSFKMLLEISSKKRKQPLQLQQRKHSPSVKDSFTSPCIYTCLLISTTLSTASTQVWAWVCALRAGSTAIADTAKRRRASKRGR